MVSTERLDFATLKAHASAINRLLSRSDQLSLSTRQEQDLQVRALAILDDLRTCLDPGRVPPVERLHEQVWEAYNTHSVWRINLWSVEDEQVEFWDGGLFDLESWVSGRLESADQEARHQPVESVIQIGRALTDMYALCRDRSRKIESWAAERRKGQKAEAPRRGHLAVITRQINLWRSAARISEEVALNVLRCLREDEEAYFRERDLFIDAAPDPLDYKKPLGLALMKLLYSAGMNRPTERFAKVRAAQYCVGFGALRLFDIRADTLRDTTPTDWAWLDE